MESNCKTSLGWSLWCKSRSSCSRTLGAPWEQPWPHSSGIVELVPITRVRWLWQLLVSIQRRVAIFNGDSSPSQSPVWNQVSLGETQMIIQTICNGSFQASPTDQLKFVSREGVARKKHLICRLQRHRVRMRKKKKSDPKPVKVGSCSAENRNSL